MDRFTPAVIAALAMGLVGCDNPPVAVVPLTPVEVITVQTAGGADGLVYSAQVEPDIKIDVAFRTDGYVVEIAERPGVSGNTRLLQAGDAVKKGDVLARVESEAYGDKVETAEANLAKSRAVTHKAEQDYRRASALQATNSITGPDFDSAQEEYETARASEQAASAQLDKANLKFGDTALVAPQDGTILQRNIELGTLVHTNTTGFVLAKTDMLKVVFGLPDIVLQAITIGTEVDVRTAAYPKRVFVGTVTEISAAANQRSHLFDVSLTVDNADGSLRPGMVASLDLNAKKLASELVAIPLKAVVADGVDGFAVYLIEKSDSDTVARLTKVATGEVLGNDIVITSGLAAGDTLIVTGTSQVADGQAVIIIP